MTLLEIREKLESWRVNTKEVHNEHIDILIALVDYLLEQEKNNG